MSGFIRDHTDVTIPRHWGVRYCDSFDDRGINTMKSALYCLATGIALYGLLTGGVSLAQSKSAIDVSVQEVVKQFNLLDPRHEQLENRAAGMLIFPQVTKGGIAVAAEYGQGVLQINRITVAYYSVASTSVGLTAGMATHSEVVLFMTQEALDKFTKGQGWSIGADTGIALMSKGMADDYDSHILKKPILGFVFGEKGLIADLSFEGTKITKISK
jgi:lipid-binding SYLF domain-containing protein